MYRSRSFPEPRPTPLAAPTSVGGGAAPLAADSKARPLAWLETSELWRRRDTPWAREELVQRFLPLARRLASCYRSPHDPYEDLIQVASVGLLGAIDRFDPDRGIAFPAFAIPTILGELKRHFRQTAWAVHVPRGAQEMALRIDHATRELSPHTGRGPRLEVLAEHLQASVEDVLLGLEAGAVHYSASLDAPAPGTDAEDDQTLADRIGSDDESIGLLEAVHGCDPPVALFRTPGTGHAHAAEHDPKGDRRAHGLLADAGLTSPPSCQRTPTQPY